MSSPLNITDGIAANLTSIVTFVLILIAKGLEILA